MSRERNQRTFALAGPRVAACLVFLCIAAVPGCTDQTVPNPPGNPGSQPPPLPPTAGDVAEEKFSWPLSPADAQRVLTDTRIFAFGGMPLKRQVHAFNVILDQSDAADRLTAIAAEGRDAGRLYALCGFQVVDPARAAILQHRLESSKEPIVLYEHDVVSRASVGEVATEIARSQLGLEMRRSRDRVYEYFRRAG